MTFTGIAILAVIVIVFDVANRIPGDDEQLLPATPTGAGTAQGKTGPPPIWVMLLMIVAIAITMLALALYWPE